MSGRTRNPLRCDHGNWKNAAESRRKKLNIHFYFRTIAHTMLRLFVFYLTLKIETVTLIMLLWESTS
jgi:hypothetical protein